MSLGSFLQVYSRALGLSQFEEDVLFMSEMVAQHDALLVAWKEKLRHDLVRPTTIITRLLGKKLIRAFIPSSLKVQKIPADEYETFIRTQPHSEFPSASAVLCSATFENLRTGLEAKFGANLTVPPFVFPVPPNTLRSIPIEVPVTIRFDNLQEATSSCAQSRLWAGVHFEPSIVAGVQLGRGVGKRAFEHISAIAAGIRPKNCVRCL